MESNEARINRMAINARSKKIKTDHPRLLSGCFAEWDSISKGNPRFKIVLSIKGMRHAHAQITVDTLAIQK